MSSNFPTEVIAANAFRVSPGFGPLTKCHPPLSLMGKNFADYIREAYRTLKLDGSLHLIEATSRFKDRDGFISGLKKLGFSVVETRNLWKFTHIHAIKTENLPQKDFQIRF